MGMRLPQLVTASGSLHTASVSLFSGSYLYLIGGGQLHGDGAIGIFVCRLRPLALASDDVVVVGLALRGEEERRRE